MKKDKLNDFAMNRYDEEWSDDSSQDKEDKKQTRNQTHI